MSAFSQRKPREQRKGGRQAKREREREGGEEKGVISAAARRNKIIPKIIKLTLRCSSISPWQQNQRTAASGVARFARKHERFCFKPTNHPSLALSLSTFLSLPLSLLHLLTLICSTDYCCILLSPPLLPPFILSLSLDASS